MQWRNDTTLPSRGLGLRPIGKSSECFRMTTGVKSGKAQNERMFFRFAPESGPSDLRVNEYELSLDRLREARSRRRAAGRDARRGSHLVWGGPKRNSHARTLPDKRAFERRAHGISSGPVLTPPKKALCRQCREMWAFDNARACACLRAALLGQT